MPMPVPPGFRIGAAEPKDAAVAFARRGLLAPSFHWHDLWQDEHAGKFMVAGVAQADVLRLFYDQLAGALGRGDGLADFARAVKPALAAKGWWGDVEITNPTTGEIRTTRFNDARLRLIYDTNLRQSYAAGRWERAQRTQARKPYLLYRTMRDERVRASHARWDGVALPQDHPFWRTHYPPNGWRCRCRAFAVSERDLERYRADGVEIKTEAPQEPEVAFRDPRTGDAAMVPVGIDPGWAYNAGRTGLEQPATLQRQALDALPPALAVELVRHAVRSENFARFLREPRPREMLPVGVLPTAQAEAIGARSRTVMLSDDTAIKQAKVHAELGPADYQWVQLALDAGERIQQGTRETIYLLERDGWVAVVKSTRTGQGVFLTSFRRLSEQVAKRDREVLRLRGKSSGGADGGASQSA